LGGVGRSDDFLDNLGCIPWHSSVVFGTQPFQRLIPPGIIVKADICVKPLTGLVECDVSLIPVAEELALRAPEELFSSDVVWETVLLGNLPNDTVICADADYHSPSSCCSRRVAESRAFCTAF